MIDQPLTLLSFTLSVTMFCSQIAMSRMYFDFHERESTISSLQQIFAAYKLLCYHRRNLFVCVARIGLELQVRIVKNCDRGLEIAARDRPQFFTLRTEPEPAK